MDGKSIRNVEYKDVDKALRLCLGVLRKSELEEGRPRTTLTPFHGLSLGICSQLLPEKGMHGAFQKKGFFLTVCDFFFVQPLEVLLKSALYGRENGVELNC